MNRGPNPPTRRQQFTLALTMLLLLFTAVFPFCQYSYSAGFPRGRVLWELSSTAGEYPPGFAQVYGRSTYRLGVGLVPCWATAGKSILWDLVAGQGIGVALVGLAAYSFSREAQG